MHYMGSSPPLTASRASTVDYFIESFSDGEAMENQSHPSIKNTTDFSHHLYIRRLLKYSIYKRKLIRLSKGGGVYFYHHHFIGWS